MEDFDSISRSLVPSDHRALILLEVPENGENIGRALRILGSLGQAAWEHEIMIESSPAIILIKMDPAWAKEAIIRLIENGFSKIITLYPKPAHSREAN
jgi:hypothetical protein